MDQTCGTTSAHFDIVLMLRICDIFSCFHIEESSRREVSTLIRRDRRSCTVDADMLRPAKLIEDNRLDKIQHSIKRFTFRNGTVFHQFSLSDYFKAIRAIMAGTVANEDGMIYVPIRRFEENVLVLPSGRSLIGQLMTMGDRIVVEDADLSPYRLRRHIDRFGLDDLCIRDVMDRTGMRGASVSLIGRRG